MMLLTRKRTVQQRGFVIRSNDRAGDRTVVYLCIVGVVSVFAIYILVKSAIDNSIAEFVESYTETTADLAESGALEAAEALGETTRSLLADAALDASKPMSKAALERIAENMAARAAKTAAFMAKRIAAAPG